MVNIKIDTELRRTGDPITRFGINRPFNRQVFFLKIDEFVIKWNGNFYFDHHTRELYHD